MKSEVLENADLKTLRLMQLSDRKSLTKVGTIQEEEHAKIMFNIQKSNKKKLSETEAMTKEDAIQVLQKLYELQQK